MKRKPKPTKPQPRKPYENGYPGYVSPASRERATWFLALLRCGK